MKKILTITQFIISVLITGGLFLATFTLPELKLLVKLTSLVGWWVIVLFSIRFINALINPEYESNS